MIRLRVLHRCTRTRVRSLMDKKGIQYGFGEPFTDHSTACTRTQSTLVYVCSTRDLCKRD